jgi:hypothetical protein
MFCGWTNFDNEKIVLYFHHKKKYKWLLLTIRQNVEIKTYLILKKWLKEKQLIEYEARHILGFRIK